MEHKAPTVYKYSFKIVILLILILVLSELDEIRHLFTFPAVKCSFTCLREIIQHNYSCGSCGMRSICAKLDLTSRKEVSIFNDLRPAQWVTDLA